MASLTQSWMSKSCLLLHWPLEKWSAGKQQRWDVDHTYFRLSEAIQESFMSSENAVGLSCKQENKSMVTENVPTEQEQKRHLQSRAFRSFKEIMKNGHQSERTSGLSPLEQHCQCFLIMLCYKCLIHDFLTSNIGLMQPGTPTNYFWK